MFYWYLQALKKYAQFSGRARRKEYWYFRLANFLGFVLAGAIDGWLEFKNEFGFGPVYLAFMGVTIVPSLAVAVRRMHDTNNSGWYYLIPFYNLYLCCTEGSTGENAYGPDPKGENDSFDFEQNQFADSTTI